jgi:hypothetical protein
MLERDRLQQDSPTAHIITQQCSSATFVSLCFKCHMKKFGVHFKNVNISILFNVEDPNCISLTLVDLQLDAQNSYSFTYDTFIKILYMLRALPCSSSGLRRNCIYAASGIVTL